MTTNSSTDPPAVLIVSDRFGLPFQRGTPTAVRLLASIFQAIGFSVYCTVLKVTEQERKEAEQSHVELICPNPRDVLKRREPNHDWFYSCNIYFPDIEKLKNVKIMTGIAIVTSDATLTTKDQLLSMAKYYIAHLWPSDVSPPSIAGWNKEEFLARAESLEKESKSATAIISLDDQTFNDIRHRFQEFADKHFQVYPTANKKYLSLSQPAEPQTSQRPRILSFLEECDLVHMDSHKLLAQAINKVAEKYCNGSEQPPKWRILGLPEADESRIQTTLQPHTLLDIIPSSMPTLQYMERELCYSHVLLIPPIPGMNSHQLMLSAMSLGIPLLVSKYSPCHDLIKEHFPLQIDNMVVDMKNAEKFADKIVSILRDPAVYWKSARQVKEKLRTTINPVVEQRNLPFIAKIQEDMKTSEDLSLDPDFERWCQSHGLEKDTMKKFHREHITNTDILKALDEEDINMLGLPIGQRGLLRQVWRQLSKPGKATTSSDAEKLKAEKHEQKTDTEVKYEDKLSDEDIGQDQSVHQGKDDKLVQEEDSKTHPITDDESVLGTGQIADSPEASERIDSDNPIRSRDDDSRCGEQDNTQLRMGSEDSDNLSSHHAESRKPGHMSLHLNTVGGIPMAGVPIGDVERDYYHLPEVLEETPKNINNMHSGLHVEAAEGNSVRYTIACETIDALEYLWKEYEALNVNKLVTSTTITDKTLKEIGALYLSIQTTLDIEEYEQCRRELHGKDDMTVSSQQEAADGDGERETKLKSQNRELRTETYELKTTITSLQGQIKECNDRIQVLNKTVKENEKMKVDVAVLQATVKERDIQIEILKENLGESEKEKAVLLDKIIHLSKENNELRESTGKERETSLSEENRQLKEEVTNLKKEVEDLQKKNIAKLKEISRLEFEILKIKGEVKGQWKVTKTLYGQSGPVKFKQVQGVTTTHLGQVVMADEDNNSVLTLKSTYEVDSEIRFDGHFPNKFKPYDVAVTTSNTYFMTDSGNDQVVMFDKSSKTTQTFCQNDDIKPRAITLLDEGFVVTDDKGHRVVKYDMNGESVAEVGGHVQPSLLYNPQCVVVNSDNNVIVSDRGRSGEDGSIKVFGKQLQYLFTMCSDVRRPYGLSVDLWDNVYNIQYPRELGRGIVKYTKNGEEVERFGDYLHWGRFIAVSKYGQPKIIVSDPDFNRVRVYTK